MKKLFEKLSQIRKLKWQIIKLKKEISTKEEYISNLEDQVDFLLSERNRYKEKNLELRRELEYLKAIARKETNNEKHSN